MSVNFQDEGEVKEYLDNIGVEYRFGCYSEKNPESCHLLGDYLESIKKDFEKARKVYQSTCSDYKYPRSCLKIGNYTLLGKGKSGQKGNPSEAAEWYSKGCALGEPACCLHAGLIHVSKTVGDIPFKRDFIKGFECLTKSCDLNNDKACFYLSGMHMTGVEKPEAQTNDDNRLSSTEKSTSKSQSTRNELVLPKNMEKAFAFAYKACELKNMYACANVSQMYLRGEGTEKNEEKAEKFKKLALEIQDETKNNRSQLMFQQTM